MLPYSDIIDTPKFDNECTQLYFTIRKMTNGFTIDSKLQLAI